MLSGYYCPLCQRGVDDMTGKEEATIEEVQAAIEFIFINRDMIIKSLPVNADFHEALSKIPVKSKKMKGKVVDEIEKGYFLNDKIIRYAKVVIGE